MRITRVLLQAVQKPTDFLPSKSFMHAKVRRPGQKTRFVQVASEIELLKDVYGEKTLKMLNINDETWHILMEMRWEERYTYLLDLLNFERKNSEKPKEIHQDILISTRNEERLVAGEMVYARNYHSLVDIYGADFRRKIDNFYGRNLMKQGDNVKKFIVDCRFLRDFSVKTQAFYTKSDTFRSSYIQLWQTARIFREYFQGLPIDECIRMNINHLVRKQSEKTKYEQQSEEEQEKDEVFRSSMYHINNCSNEGEENPESMQRKQMKPPSSSLSLSRQHRNRHRGSSSSF
uniref:Uncharacterized protein n=1 Tax=Caenorhabditis tropicalis TaxID=1561998 RepID=A0A1I7T6Z7_9PELO